MTLSAYLSLLSLGSTIQTRSNAECQEEEQEELDHLKRMSCSIAKAEVDTVSSVSIHHAPSERKVEVNENVAGVVLAISTMVFNYSLCFPIVAARHRLQALPTRYSYLRDTPLYGARVIHYTYKNGGIRRLYPGFGLGLIGQTLNASYESGLNQVMSKAISVPKNNWLLRKTVAVISKMLGLVINIPLYPLYRNALILRVQSDTDLTRIVIFDHKDFIRRYKQDLKDFAVGSFNRQHVVAAFLPSCILYMVTEQLLIFIYKRIFHLFSPSKSLDSSSSRKKKDSTVLHTYYTEIACGVISSVVTRAITYPMDTVVFKLMIQDSGVLKINTAYKGFFDCIKQTWLKEGGWKAFYPGWGIGLLEISMGYLVLEASWWAYRATLWKLQTPTTSDTRAVRKAQKLRERLL